MFLNSNTLNDLLFTVRYMPKAVTTTVKYGLYGAILGYGISYLCTESLNQFAEKNHEAVDINNAYVANDEEFLKTSRSSAFNQITPPISQFLPCYSAIVGAGAGTLFSLSKICKDYSEQLKEDREIRKLNIV